MRFDDVMCRNCGFVFAGKRPDENFLEQYYVDAHDAYEGAVSVDIDYDSEARLEVIRKYLPAGSKILEPGAGAGHFCAFLSTHGYNAEGLDPKDQGDKQGVRKGYVSTEDGACEEHELCDALISYYVMEHVRLPGKWLQQICRFLKPGGYFIAEVPDFETCPLECLNDEHLLHYRSEHLQALLKRYGFEIVDGHARTSRYFGFTVVAKWVNPELLDNPQDFDAAFDGDSIKEENREHYDKAKDELTALEQIAQTTSEKVISLVRSNDDMAVYFWGANEYACRIARVLKPENMNLNIIDNADSKVGLVYEGFQNPVVSPRSHDIPQEGRKLFIICSPAWNEAIKDQIRDMGFEQYEILDGTRVEGQ